MGVPAWLRFKRKDVATALSFIAIGVCVRLLLLGYANIEPVMALTIIASMVMPLALAAMIPLGIMAITDVMIYAFQIPGQYGLGMIIGITFFVWTGFLMATLAGWRLRKRFKFRIKNLGVITGAGVLATLVFDLWTDVGVWWFAYPDHTFANAIRVLQLQVTFTIAHVISTLIFIPLFGSGYLLLTEHEAELSAQAPRDSPEGEARPDA